MTSKIAYSHTPFFINTELNQQTLRETSLDKKFPCTDASQVVLHTIDGWKVLLRSDPSRASALAGRNMKFKWLRFFSEEGQVVQGSACCYYAGCIVRLVLQLHVQAGEAPFPHALSTELRVLIWALLYLACGESAGPGFASGVIKNGWQAYPMSPSSKPGTRCSSYMTRTRELSNMRLSWAEPGQLATTLKN